MRIYCFDDPWSWGRGVVNSAQISGIESHIFTNPDDIQDLPDTFAFIHISHNIYDKECNKNVCKAIDQKKNVKLIPSITECLMYDDKMSYYEKCPGWAPKTFVIKSKNEAFKILGTMNFPMISKSSDGAASSNVRLITDRGEAIKEISLVFEEGGIKKYQGTQVGYLIWQRFCPGNSNDWRVILIAKKYGYVLKRNNRDNVPFASGSGKLEPISSLDSLTYRLLEFTRKFAIEYNFVFVGVDIVFDENKKPVILEITTGWDINGYENCMIHEYNGNEFVPIGLDGKNNMFDVIVKACVNKEF